MNSATTDVVSTRMGQIRQKGTLVESLVGTVLRELGFHYRKNVKRLPGSPDFANKSRRWTVFVNGCYWHHHTGCQKATIPKSNTEFWVSKFRANRQRDAKAISQLRRDGYSVVIVWECQLGSARQKLSKLREAGRIKA